MFSLRSPSEHCGRESRGQGAFLPPSLLRPRGLTHTEGDGPRMAPADSPERRKRKKQHVRNWRAKKEGEQGMEKDEKNTELPPPKVLALK